jgi:hypothetical protein
MYEAQQYSVDDLSDNDLINIHGGIQVNVSIELPTGIYKISNY